MNVQVGVFGGCDIYLLGPNISAHRLMTMFIVASLFCNLLQMRFVSSNVQQGFRMKPWYSVQYPTAYIKKSVAIYAINDLAPV